MKFSIKTSHLIRGTYIVALLFFLFTALKTYNSSYHILTDAAYYLMGADNLAHGNGFSSYNLGYLSDSKINDFKELIPITRYQPLYSVCISGLIKLGIESLTASRFANLIFLAIFLLVWINLYNKIFENKYYSALASLFLMFSSGIFTYFMPPHSEMLFLAQLGILGNLIYYWNSFSGNVLLKKYLISATIGLILLSIVLTRYAGIGFVLGFYVSVFFLFENTKTLDKLKHILIIGSIFAVGFAVWAFRNIQIMGSISSKYPDNYFGSLFDFDRIIEVLNLFLVFSLGLPSFIENYAFLIIFPFLFILGFLFYKKKLNRNPINYWFLIAIFVYISMIIYTSIGNRAIDRINGFQRFFALTQPFLIGILLFMLHSFKKIPKSLLANLSKVFIIGLVSVSLLSGINRTRIFFQTLPGKEKNTDFYESIKQNASENDLILSNEWQNVSARTSLPIVQMHYKNDIDNLKKYYRGNYNSVFLVLEKNVGVTYRKGVDTWTEILEDNKYDLIKENDKSIFVKLY